MFRHHGSAPGRAAAAGGGGVQGVNQYQVRLRSDGLLQARPELLETVIVQPTFEDAFLHPHAVVPANLRHAPKAAGTGDVVSDDAEHFVSAGRMELRLGRQQIVPPAGFAGLIQLTRNGA